VHGGLSGNSSFLRSENSSGVGCKSKTIRFNDLPPLVNLAFVGERGVYGLLHCHRRELVRWYFSILVLRLLKDMRIAEEVELIY
jgi:hypothetical protein